jgi:dUTP pyrophosphatase
MVSVKVRLIEGGKLPEIKSAEACCLDCYARVPNGVVIEHGERALILLGFAMELPVGYELQIRPRSGLSKKGIDVALGSGDSDYRGEYCANVINNSHSTFNIQNGDRICQCGVREVPSVSFKIVDELSESERGYGGFGHTGI